MESKKDERKESNTPKAKKIGSTTTKKQTSAKKTGSTTTKTQSNTKKAGTTTTKTKSNIEKSESTAKKTQSKVEKKDTNINDESKIDRTARTQTQRKTGNRFLSFIWNILVKLVTIAIIFISIITTNNQEAFLGFRIFRVQTGSMIPTYQVGDVILVKEVNPDTIQIGDDVTYQGKVGSMKGMLVTHRVIDIEEVDGKRVFHTKGIANNSEDPVVSEEQINGVVQTKMYILSLICMLLNNKYVFYFCGILPLTIYVAFRLFKGKKVKRIEREN